MLTTYRDIDRTFARMDRLVGSLLSDPRLVDPLRTATRAASEWPAVDLFTRDDRYELVAELPGMAADELELTVEDGVLTLAGERKLEAPEGYTALSRERRAFKFSRRFRLPEDVDWDGIRASARDGLLTVLLPKAPAVQPRRIAVESA